MTGTPISIDATNLIRFKFYNWRYVIFKDGGVNQLSLDMDGTSHRSYNATKSR